jgi:hypothetical protein
MTTKVVVTCPDNSHWPLKVITQDCVFDAIAREVTTEWKDTSSVELRVGEKHETYVHSSRRLVIEEVPTS